MRDAPITPTDIAHANGWKKILVRIRGNNPPIVVAVVVTICLVALVTV